MADPLLGTDKDVEALARRARRAGWTVDVDGGTHLRWRAPDGREFRSPLTGGRGHRRRVEQHLAEADPAHFGELAPAVARRQQVATRASILAAVPPELEAVVAELEAAAELLDEVLAGGPIDVDDLDTVADTVQDGRALLRTAEDRLREAARAARAARR